jgi:hypothetical protein
MIFFAYIGVIDGKDSTSSGFAVSNVKQPTTAHDLLLNMRTVLEEGLLIPQSFYTEDNLVRFFGGSRFEWTANTETLKEV